MNALGRTVFLPLAVLMLGIATAAPALAADPSPSETDARLDLLFGEHEPYRDFLRDLKRAVAQNSREGVAALVSYPLRTRLGGKWVHLHSPAQFLQHYDELLSQPVRRVIADCTYEGLFAKSQGVMIGDGQIWFGAVCQDKSCGSRTVRITAFNP